MADNPVGSKIYLQPVKMIYEAIRDIVELQRAKVTCSDANPWSGKVNYFIRFYGAKQEYRFSIADIEGRRSYVKLEMSGRDLFKPELNDMVQRQFVLLDSMLITHANTEYVRNGGTDDE